jgi:arabinogalactan oligomer/maltooligosaccharide transport system permease protein
LKYIALLFVFSFLLLFIQSAFAKKEYEIGVFLLIALILIAVTYLTSVSIPLKFFLPGILFLTAFVLAPILYTVAMSTVKYQTGNYISKTEAIDRINLLAIAPDEAGTTFDVVTGKTGSEIAILASDPVNKSYFLSTPTDRILLDIGQLTLDENGVATSAKFHAFNS